MQHRKSHRYMRRRLGFLYHGVKSSATRRVTMGSAADPTLTIVAVGGADGQVLYGLGDEQVSQETSNSYDRKTRILERD